MMCCRQEEQPARLKSRRVIRHGYTTSSVCARFAAEAPSPRLFRGASGHDAAFRVLAAVNALTRSNGSSHVVRAPVLRRQLFHMTACTHVHVMARIGSEFLSGRRNPNPDPPGSVSLWTARCNCAGTRVVAASEVPFDT